MRHTQLFWSFTHHNIELRDICVIMIDLSIMDMDPRFNEVELLASSSIGLDCPNVHIEAVSTLLYTVFIAPVSQRLFHVDKEDPDCNQ